MSLENNLKLNTEALKANTELLQKLYDLKAGSVAAPAVAFTAEEMNAAIVAEFKRIGAREPIDAVMTAMGINGVNECPAEKQQELIAAIKAIQS